MIEMKGSYVEEFIKAFMLIFVAEMGDKTQILAMAFATRYAVKKVLLGIFIGAFLNHGLAVLLGSYLSRLIPVATLQVIAGFAFVGFALWTLKAEDESDEKHKSMSKLGPVITVALAFFIGELGDKTQLTAITMAADAKAPIAILAGTVLGMVVTGGLGIFVGRKLGDKLPDLAIKLIASAVFLFFGITKLYNSLPARFLKAQYIALFAAFLLAAFLILAKPVIVKLRSGHETAFRRASRELYDYYNRISHDMDCICLGEENCGRCEGNDCIVGYTRSIIKSCIDGNISKLQMPSEVDPAQKPFSRDQALHSLILTLDLIRDDPNNSKYRYANEIRKSMEKILFGKSIDRIEDWEEYKKSLMEADETIAAALSENGHQKSNKLVIDIDAT